MAAKAQATAKPKVQWRKFRSYSGPRILGTDVIPPPVGPRENYHVDRAYWLTTKVETGAKFGSIVMYDGTAMTAGPDQHIAVYPKELANEDYDASDDQGGLWKLLRRLETVRSSESYHQAIEWLWALLGKAGWYVSQDGYLRYMGDWDDIKVGRRTLKVQAGQLVHGAHIRDVLTPTGGKVPKTGDEWDNARGWAKAFHAVFSHPGGFHAQLEFGKEHLVERTKKRRINLGSKAKRNWKKLRDIYPAEVSALNVTNRVAWPVSLDLAMCVYQSHSVNAPAIANKALARAVRLQGGMRRPDFAAKLIGYLGNSTYGRWDDDLTSGRYQRTRSAARASGLWPRSLFDGRLAIMPKDLPG